MSRTLAAILPIAVQACSPTTQAPPSLAQLTSPTPSTLTSPAAHRYQAHRLASYSHCAAMESLLDALSLHLKVAAARRTLWGGVITAAAGAGGSIATAIASSQQSVSASGTSVRGKDLTTVLGAVTAGTTAVTGALTLAVVGPAPAETLAAVDAAKRRIVEAWAGLEERCSVGEAAGLEECAGEADAVGAVCTGAARGVGLVVPDVADGATTLDR